MVETRPKQSESWKEDVPCDLCGSDDFDELFTSSDLLLRVDEETHRLVRCRECGLIYVNPRPTAEHLPRYYPSSYEPFGAKDNSAQRLADFVEERNASYLANLLVPRSRVLEVGCGRGQLLRRLKDRGFVVQGVENSPHAVKHALEQGVKVFNGTLFDAALPESSFDAVILKHVIEHMPSPSAALAEINRVLKPGGYILLWLPNAGSWEAKIFGRYWHGYDLPRHLYAFNRQTITALLYRHGFRILRLRYSIVPNDLIRSARHVLSAKTGFPAEGLNTGNLALLALLTPVASLLGLFRRSGRIIVFGRKNPGV